MRERAILGTGPARKHSTLRQEAERVEFRVAMTPEDLARAGLDALGKTWGKA